MTTGTASRASSGGAEPPPATTSLRHPATLLAIAVVATCALISVSYALYDSDLWQHLAVGRVIWQTHSVPMRHLWTWPNLGQRLVLPSWGFRAFLWPVWRVGGIPALFAWRWITTLAAFGLCWALARRMGARTLLPLVVVTAAVLVYRERSMVRPETLVAPLLALELTLLEWRRLGARDHTAWLPLLLCIWINLHVSWPLGLLLIAFYALDDLVAHRASPGSSARHWALVGSATILACLVNPFGWRAMWEPFDYWLHLRNDPLFRMITELKPVDWRHDLAGPLGALLLVWPLLLAWRARHDRFDLAASLTCVMFSALLLSSRRYESFTVLVATPSLARDLEAWCVASVPGIRRWSAPLAATITATICVAMSLWVWSRDHRPVRMDFLWSTCPVAACDRITHYGIRGRGFNQFELGGYMLYRFYPDKSRLPFMDIHQTGSSEDRRLCALAETDPRGWQQLDARYRFDYALAQSREAPTYRLLQYLDADTAWACVFMDDAARLFVRRRGPLAAVAMRYGYHVVGASDSACAVLGAACERDTALRAAAKLELQRMTAESPANAEAHKLLANIALLDDDPATARDHLRIALAQDPWALQVHERLGLAALMAGEPRVALGEFRHEAAVSGWGGDLPLLMGTAFARTGERRQAVEWFRRALALDPGDAEARDSLAALGAPER